MRAIKDKQPDQQYNAIAQISEKDEECVDKDSGQRIFIFQTKHRRRKVHAQLPYQILRLQTSTMGNRDWRFTCSIDSTKNQVFRS